MHRAPTRTYALFLAFFSSYSSTFLPLLFVTAFLITPLPSSPFLSPLNPTLYYYIYCSSDITDQHVYYQLSFAENTKYLASKKRENQLAEAQSRRENERKLQSWKACFISFMANTWQQMALELIADWKSLKSNTSLFIQLIILKGNAVSSEMYDIYSLSMYA
jgi:hypothetical protein